MGCTHDITEREVVVTADGYCPLCMAAEIEQLRADKTAISQTASDFLHEIERLRAENGH